MNMKIQDLSGKKFGNLLVLKRQGSDRFRNPLWITLCDCGKEHLTRSSCLKNGSSQSCGCRMSFRKSTLDRFWENVCKSDKCWIWKGWILAIGYGGFSIKGKFIYAHRFSYEIHNGKIPDGKLICHTCDNRICVNPSHFFLGSHLDNSKDMVNKGRNKKGENVVNHKLKNEDIINIRCIRKEGISYNKIAQTFGISYSTSRSICLKLTWNHI